MSYHIEMMIILLYSVAILIETILLVNHPRLILYLYYFLVVVHRGPHGRLAFFFAKCVTL